MKSHFKANSLDDLLRDVYQMLLKSTNRIQPTKPPAVEEAGILLELTNPRARLSRAWSRLLLFGCLGELMWYLSASNELDFIEYYLSDYHKYAEPDRTIFGAYGPRLFDMHGKGINQIENVISRLKKNQYSRKAVIQLFDASDILEHHEDVPCTCTFQFLLRRNRLHMITNMRSNDAYMGLPHDIFTFTMIQEIIANSLGVELGTYKHMVGNHDRLSNSRASYLLTGFDLFCLNVENTLRPSPRTKEIVVVLHFAHAQDNAWNSDNVV